MQIVHSNQVSQHKNSDTCLAHEYLMTDNDLNGAMIELSGRYPENGRVVNHRCKEMCYVLEGSGRVVIGELELELKVGDLVLIEPEERYFWEGHLKFFTACTPAWYPEQHEQVR